MISTNRFRAALAALVLLSAPAAAQVVGGETNWIISTGTGGCPIGFSEEPYGTGSQVIIPSAECERAGFERLAAWHRNGNTFFIEALNDAGGLDVVARLNPRGDGTYEGVYGDGDIIELRHASTYGAGPATNSQPRGAARACLAYQDGGCVDLADEGPPEASGGWPSLMTRARMNVRDAPGADRRYLGTIERNQCVTATRCIETPRNERWCEVEFGVERGWMLQSDGATVFMQSGCG